ncbi:MAG: hypothetical protein JXL80_13355 [Planctomycetes bacterium]|nr:hypothetical protein [Planctomycetota bacterium]
MSKTILEISPAWRDLLAAHGLDSFEALFGYEGGQSIDGHRDRNVVRLELTDAEDRTVPLYLKREWNPKAAMVVRRWLANWLRPPLSRSRREWRNLQALAARHTAVAEPVAMGEERRGGFFKRALLVVREVPGAVNLAEYLNRCSAAPAAAEARDRHALARELGGYVRRMHDAGMAYRDLYAKHIFVQPSPGDGGSFVPTLIDAQRAHRFPHLSPHHRWRDLAALDTTLRETAATRTDRLRFVLAYARQSRLTPATREMIVRVSGRSDRLGGRGRDPRLFEARDEAPAGMVPLASENFRHIDDQRILVVERFLPVLRSLGLDTVEKVMAYRGGKSYRDVPDRLTVRIPFTWDDGRESALYLKRHQKVDTGAWIEGLVFWRKALTRAEAEYRNIFQLIHARLATPHPVAWGQDHRWSIRQPSFLATEEIAGSVPADDYLRDRFASPDADASAKRELVRQIAQLARRFHGQGFCHRDFYLCHLFVREASTDDESSSPFILHLIDLQRVRRSRRGRRVGRRWIVKDLAALNYSAPAGIVTRTDKLRFLRPYLGLARLDVAARDLVRDVAAKTARIARHDAKLQARKNR